MFQSTITVSVSTWFIIIFVELLMRDIDVEKIGISMSMRKFFDKCVFRAAMLCEQNFPPEVPKYVAMQ